MRITKQKLKEIIKEVMEGPEPAPPQSTWPGSTQSLMALAPVAKALAGDLGEDEFEIATKLTNLIKVEFY